MTRFEIQDLVAQNRDGVTFRALDKSTNQIVSLRRFFPFGQCDEEEEGGEGLDPQEGKAFSSACAQLSRINHPALRRTIFGETDPIDGMPFLVTEWLEGESLADVLGNNKMEPSMIIGLVRQALDVCLVLSKTLKNEAVWIDTKIESIIVTNPVENPSFSFRICPFKWLGTQSHQKDLTGIVSMVEALMGWKSKLVSDQAGMGLGGWLKLLRQNPQMPLQDALLALPDPSLNTPTEQPVDVANKTIPQPYILPSAAPTSLLSKKNIIIMVLSACFTGILIFLFYQQNKKNKESAETATTVPMDDQTSVEPTKTLPVTPPKEETKPETQETVPDTKPPVPEPEKQAQVPPKAGIELPKTTSKLPIAATPVAWYDATSAVFHDNKVSIANSAGKDDFITGPATLAKNGIGSLQAVQLNGINEYLTGDIEIKGASLTAFYVGKSSNAMQTEYATMMTMFDKAQTFDWNNEKGAVLFSQNKAIANSIYTHRNGTELSSATGTLTNGFLAGAVFNGTTHTLHLNGASSKSVATAGNLDSNKVILGARWQSGSIVAPYWNGMFGEVLVFNSELSESHRQKIEGYLAHKWNLTSELAANHPYKSSSPSLSSPDKETPANLKTNETPPSKPDTTPKNLRFWTPEHIATTAWYDAADNATLTSSSGTVSRWLDKSGNGLHLAQDKAGNQPNTGAKINGVNALDFTGDVMTTSKNPFGSTIKDAFVIAVHKVDKLTQGNLFHLGGNWTTHAPWRDGNLYFDTAGAMPPNRLMVNYGVGLGSAVLTSWYGSTSDNVQQVYKNGTMLAEDNSGNPVNTNSMIGIGAMDANYQDATLGEFIIINGTVDEPTRQKLEGYLAHKWELAAELPNNHPYKSIPPLPSVLLPGDAANIATLKDGEPATIQGVVRSAKLSSTGKSIYLSFSEPEVESDIRIVIHGSEFEGTPFEEAEFAKLVGKDLVFDGIVYRENFNNRPPFVKITDKKQIKLAHKKPDQGQSKNICSPDDAQVLAKMELKEPVTVRGVVKSVKIPKQGAGLYFSFSDPYDGKQIRVVTYPAAFENGPYDGRTFKNIEADYQHLVGKSVTFNGTVTRHKDDNYSQFVFIHKRDQIVVEEPAPNSAVEIKHEFKNPETASPINNIKPGSRVKIEGRLRSVRFNKEQTAIVLMFTGANQEDQLCGVAYKVNYKDQFDIKNFEPFEGKRVSVDGVLIVDANNDRYIEIINLNQVSLIQQ